MKHLDLTVGSLLYADDVSLLAESKEDLQIMLNVLYNWCCRWRLTINESKTQILHFRKKQKPRSPKAFSCDNLNLEYTSLYKYLGFVFDEFMNYEKGIQVLADSAGRALGSGDK